MLEWQESNQQIQDATEAIDHLQNLLQDAIYRQISDINSSKENNCAVLSITGYPQSIFDTTMQMLRRNPDLKSVRFARLQSPRNWFS